METNPWPWIRSAMWWLADFWFYKCALNVLMCVGCAHDNRLVYWVVRRLAVARRCLELLNQGEDPREWKLTAKVVSSGSRGE